MWPSCRATREDMCCKFTATYNKLGACCADSQQLRPPGVVLAAAAVSCVWHASFKPLLMEGPSAAHLC